MSRRETTTDNDNERNVNSKKQRSNVFAAFEPAQIKEFRIIFNMIDQNHDGFIDKTDLHDVLVSLGKDPTDDYLESMMNDAPGPIDFAAFLMLFYEKLRNTDPGNVLKNAFGHFDENNEGVIDADKLREFLITTGDKFTEKEVDEMYREAPISHGLFDYVEFTLILKRGTKDKDRV